MLLEGVLLQLFRLQVVERQRDFLVLIILIVVVQVQVSPLLGSHHPAHQLHSGVVAAAVTAALGLDGHLAQQFLVGLEGNVQLVADLVVDVDGARLVAYGAEGEGPAIMADNGIAATGTRNDSHLMPFVNHTGIRNAVACLFVSNDTLYLLGVERHPGPAQDHQYQQPDSFHLIILYGRFPSGKPGRIQAPSR